MPIIDPTILKRLRKQRGWSQEELARNARVGKKTIQRIEAGEDPVRSTEPHGSTVAKIAKALGQPVEVLTGDLKLPSSTPEPPKQFTDVMRETFGAASNLNFDLVTARYGVSAEEVVQLAPLLFAIYAEKSRKLIKSAATKLDAERSVEDLLLDWRDTVSGDASTAIRKANVFGDPDSESYWNPFVELLDRELTDAGDAAPGSMIKLEFGPKLRWHALLPGNRVPYVEVCPLDLDRLTCLDPEVRFALKMGFVRIGEIPPELLAAHRGVERVTWILEKLAERHRPSPDESGKD